MEVDFGESWADIAGAPCKVKYLVATLPFSNAYFAKAYPVERLESLLDGIESAFKYFRGVVDRVVLDNTSLAVKDVLAGRDRVQTEAFEAFRGAYPIRAELCAPAKGWEKGSVENGVKYVRNLVFRPRLAVESWAALNATIRTELEADLPTRHLDDGRPVQEALALERQHLRALPEHLPATCRIVARVADKFGHVRVDHVTYSVPVRHAWRPVWVKLYHDRVAIAVGAEVVAEHPRAFSRGTKVLDPFHGICTLYAPYAIRCRDRGAGRVLVSTCKLRRKDGAGERTRTADLLITNQLLYQLSYAGFPCANEEGLSAATLLRRNRKC